MYPIQETRAATRVCENFPKCFSPLLVMLVPLHWVQQGLWLVPLLLGQMGKPPAYASPLPLPAAPTASNVDVYQVG